MYNAGKVTVRKRNGKRGVSWEYRFEIEPVDGKRRWKSKSGFLRKTEADKAGNEARQKYMELGDHKEQNVSVAAVAEQWLEYIAEKREVTTYVAYLSPARVWVIPKLGKMPIAELTTADIEQVLREMRDAGKSKSMMHSAFTVMSGIVQYAVRHQYIQKNIARDVEIPDSKRKKVEREPYTVEQIEQIRAAMPEEHPYRLPIMLGIFCGLRISEAVGITWDCVDFNNGTLAIDKQLKQVAIGGKMWDVMKRPKSKRSVRTIGLSATAIQELAQVKLRQQENRKRYGAYYRTTVIRPEDGPGGKPLEIVHSVCTPMPVDVPVDLVCRKPTGEHVSNSCVQEYAKILTSELGFKISTHTGRHTHATLAAESGASAIAIAARLGQDSVDVTAKYIHATSNMDRQALDAFEQAVGAK